MQLFRLFHNEREIDELTGELAHKNQTLDKENRRQQKIEDELKDRKKEHGKLMKDITKLEQQLKDSVRDTSSLSLTHSLSRSLSVGSYLISLSLHICLPSVLHMGGMVEADTG